VAARACLYRSAVKVVDVVVEDNVDTAGGKILLDPLAILVGVGRVEKLGVGVNDGNCLVGERVLDLARIL